MSEPNIGGDRLPMPIENEESGRLYRAFQVARTDQGETLKAGD